MPSERRSSPFCCAGCEAVATLLQQEGLTRFYDLGGRATGAVGAAPRVPAFDWLAELERAGTTDQVVRLVVDVQGLRCAACVWLLRSLWQREAGGIDLQVAPSLGRVTMVYRRDGDTARRFLTTAARLGYPMAPPSRRLERDTGLLVRLGICAAIAMNAMILAVSLYFGLDTSAEGGDATLRSLFGWVLMGLGAASVLVGGPVFFRTALNGVRAGVVHMDLPISLGILLAFGGSVHGQLTGGPTYFDTVSTFVALMLGGRFLQQRTLAKSRDQVLADDGAEHLRARRVTGDGVDLVPIERLSVGDELLLAPGDLVPVRGRLLAAGASFSLDWINGESEPRAFARGDEVPAGAFQAGRSAVRLAVTAGYVESGLGALLSQDPIDREDTRGRVRFWHLLNRYYAIGALLAALVGALAWLAIDPSRAMPVAVAVLVVTCPCAMGIATPLAFHLALASLRRRGVFVRSKSLLDKLRVVRKVVFDKTGTVTFGGLRAHTDDGIPAGELPMLATLAASSNHPAAQAVLQAIAKAPLLDTVEVVEHPGRGVELRLGDEVYRLGSRAFCGGGGRSAAREVVFARGGAVVAAFSLIEDFRTGTADELRALQDRGLEVHLLSGDRDDNVRAAALELGLPVERAHGGMSPSDKATAVAALDRDDLLMVGDGLNDAPAFAAAFCAGTPAMDRPVLPSRADFCFRGARAGAVADLIETAELHARVVRTNLALALAYNATVLTLSFAGLMTPLLCAVLMPVSSVALVLHTSLRMQPREKS